MKESLLKLILMTLLLASSAVCEVVVEAQNTAEPVNENSSENTPVERRLKNKSKKANANNEDKQTHPPPVIDHTEILKDSFARLDSDKYNGIIRQFEKATKNYNLMADEEMNLNSEFGKVGTVVHIPLHPIAFKHMLGHLEDDDDGFKARKAKQVGGRSGAHEIKKTKKLDKATKANANKSKLINNEIRKERILAEIRSSPHRRTERALSLRHYGYKKFNKKRKSIRRHHRNNRRKSRKLKINIPSVDQVFHKIQARNAKLGNDCGGDGITTATAIPQMFDAGITVHNYGPTPSAHPLFMDMLDQDNQPRYIDATVTIPPPRKLTDNETESNHIAL